MGFLVLYAFALCLLGLVLTGVVLTWLRRKAILDAPNDRSNHTVPTPRGGGIAVSASLLVGWWGIGIIRPDLATGLPMALILPVLGLCLISWIDDLKGLGAAIRLPAHLLACCIGALALPGEGAVFQGVLPGWLDLTLTVLIWTGFLNFYNFMDGIDGITGVETVAIAIGLVLVATFLPHETLPLAGPIAVGAATLGFLWWNWSPAKLFMGDIGSIPLGFALGWFLLFLAAKGYWVAAVILPGYYLMDAGVTLIRRAARLEKIWQAHKEHFYQRAVAARLQAGSDRADTHRRISAAIAGLNACLIGLAVTSIHYPWISLGVALCLTVGFMRWLTR